MTIEQWLKTSAKKLETTGVGTANLDVLVLLEDELGKDRSWLLAHPDYQIKRQSLETLQRQIKRRVKHEPLSYIRGKTEFYGGGFWIDKRVLEPRPESETMIELLLELAKSQKLKTKNLVVADVGTGSGALAITASLELKGTQVVATDIDPKCLEIARHNATNHKTDIKFYEGDLLHPLSAIGCWPTVILANLPYVPARHQINRAARHEPDVAIFGGGDGLALYRKLFLQLSFSHAKPRYVLIESLPFQHAGLQLIAKSAGFKLHRHQDLIQVFSSE